MANDLKRQHDSTSGQSVRRYCLYAAYMRLICGFYADYMRRIYGLYAALFSRFYVNSTGLAP